MLAGITTGGIYLFSDLSSNSAIKRLIASIDTAASTLHLVQASSQRLLQTAPQTAGKGF